MPVLWALANPKIGEREATQAIFEANGIEDRILSALFLLLIDGMHRGA
jgi:hypothetical protein